MASIRKRGENSYLLVVSRGYDYQGNRLKPAQKTVHPPLGLTAKQTQKWLNEQAVLYEQEVKHTPGQPVDSSITLAKYIEIWLEQVAPKKLAASTLVRDRQDIRRILPALGHYKLTELNKEILRDFYDAMRREKNENTGDPLAEKTVEGIHSCLCGILSDAVEAGYITHNPAWRAYKMKGASKERPVADEETVQRLITALETQSLKYEVYYKLILATGMRRGEACGLRWSDIGPTSMVIVRGVTFPDGNLPDPRMELKNKASQRILPIPARLRTILEQTPHTSEYVVPSPSGEVMTSSCYERMWNTCVRPKVDYPIHAHMLRHTYATTLYHAGIDLRTAQQLLGHATIQMTAHIYTHLEAADSLTSVHQLNEFWDKSSQKVVNR